MQIEKGNNMPLKRSQQYKFSLDESNSYDSSNNSPFKKRKESNDDSKNFNNQDLSNSRKAQKFQSTVNGSWKEPAYDEIKANKNWSLMMMKRNSEYHVQFSKTSIFNFNYDKPIKQPEQPLPGSNKFYKTCDNFKRKEPAKKKEENTTEKPLTRREEYHAIMEEMERKKMEQMIIEEDSINTKNDIIEPRVIKSASSSQKSSKKPSKIPSHKSLTKNNSLTRKMSFTTYKSPTKKSILKIENLEKQEFSQEDNKINSTFSQQNSIVEMKAKIKRIESQEVMYESIYEQIASDFSKRKIHSDPKKMSHLKKIIDNIRYNSEQKIKQANINSNTEGNKSPNATLNKDDGLFDHNVIYDLIQTTLEQSDEENGEDNKRGNVDDNGNKVENLDSIMNKLNNINKQFITDNQFLAETISAKFSNLSSPKSNVTISKKINKSSKKKLNLSNNIGSLDNSDTSNDGYDENQVSVLNRLNSKYSIDSRHDVSSVEGELTLSDRQINKKGKKLMIKPYKTSIKQTIKTQNNISQNNISPDGKTKEKLMKAIKKATKLRNFQTDNLMEKFKSTGTDYKLLKKNPTLSTTIKAFNEKKLHSHGYFMHRYQYDRYENKKEDKPFMNKTRVTSKNSRKDIKLGDGNQYSLVIDQNGLDTSYTSFVSKKLKRNLSSTSGLITNMTQGQLQKENILPKITHIQTNSQSNPIVERKKNLYIENQKEVLNESKRSKSQLKNVDCNRTVKLSKFTTVNTIGTGLPRLDTKMAMINFEDPQETKDNYEYFKKMNCPLKKYLYKKLKAKYSQSQRAKEMASQYESSQTKISRFKKREESILKSRSRETTQFDCSSNNLSKIIKKEESRIQNEKTFNQSSMVIIPEEVHNDDGLRTNSASLYGIDGNNETLIFNPDDRNQNNDKMDQEDALDFSIEEHMQTHNKSFMFYKNYFKHKDHNHFSQLSKSFFNNNISIKKCIHGESGGYMNLDTKYLSKIQPKIENKKVIRSITGDSEYIVNDLWGKTFKGKEGSKSSKSQRFPKKF